MVSTAVHQRTQMTTDHAGVPAHLESGTPHHEFASGTAISPTRRTSPTAYELREVSATAGDSRYAPIPPSVSQFRISGLSTWTGRVLEVDGDTFTAELVADGQSSQAALQADFLTHDVVVGEERLVPGDVIYVTVRTVRSFRGLPSTTSSVRLRRLGKWTEKEVASQLHRAEQHWREVEHLIG